MWWVIITVAILSACLASYIWQCWDSIRANQKLALVDHFEYSTSRGGEKDTLLTLGIRAV